MQGFEDYEKVSIVTFCVRRFGLVGRRSFMAATKKTTAAKEEAAKVADTKTDEVKTAKEAPAAKTETVTETTTEVKKRGRKPAAEKTTATAKKPGRKPAAEKTAVKKETVKKETVAKKAAVKEAVHIQFGGKSYASEDLVKSAKDVWVYDLKQDEKDFKSVELYVKPEENIVYYVINGEVQGNFNI